MDGIESMEGEGPTAGSVYKANKILISEDPLALDTVAINMMGMTIEDIPILDSAIKRKLGQWDMDHIKIEGDYDHVPQLKDYKLPKAYRTSKKKNSKAVIKVIDFFKARPVINMKKCKECNMCVESCPVKVIDINTKAIDYNQCIECMCCHELCMHKAVDLKSDNKLAGFIAKLSASRV